MFAALFVLPATTFAGATRPQILQLAHPARETIVKARVNPACGAASIEMIETAARLALLGKIQGICYAPLNKAAMRQSNPAVSSETSLFASLLGARKGYGEINMVDNVWTTRVTSHIPLKEVSQSLTTDAVLAGIVLAFGTLQKAGYTSPRIGVAALNPHAGEAGLCGDEEITTIAPAIEKANAMGIAATGPYPSDILFVKAFDGLLDAGVTMYHDQGQIALKLKGFSRGVTLAGGLPVPITTCAHGTGFDIVGQNRANTGSFENALALAAKMAGG
ncbi:MAG: 4-hydroxythreonine-4-phosphate dehydrogenase PdxA [Oscillospiraceae bacterium]